MAELGVKISKVNGAVRLGAESGRGAKGSSRAEVWTVTWPARPGVGKGSVRKGLGVLFLLTSRGETVPAQLGGRQETGQRGGRDVLLAPGLRGREERKHRLLPLSASGIRILAVNRV